MKADLQFNISIYKDDMGVDGDYYIEKPSKWFPHILKLWNEHSILPRIGESIRPNISMNPVNQFEKWIIDSDNKDIVVNSGLVIEEINWSCHYITEKPVVDFWLRLDYHENYYKDYEV